MHVNASFGSLDVSSFKKLIYKFSTSVLGWSVLTVIIIFLSLYFINPPFVQQKRTENDLSKPLPNIYCILGVSAACGVVVLGLVKYSSLNNSERRL